MTGRRTSDRISAKRGPEERVRDLFQQLGRAIEHHVDVAPLASDLVKLGVSQRGALRTRGTLLQPASSEMDETSATRLVDCIRRPEAAGALRAIGEWAGEGAAAAVAAALASSWQEPSLRAAAIEALRLIGGTDSAHALVRVASTEEDEELRERSLHALVDLVSTEETEGGPPFGSPVAEAIWELSEEEGSFRQRLEGLSTFSLLRELVELPEKVRDSDVLFELARDVRAGALGLADPILWSELFAWSGEVATKLAMDCFDEARRKGDRWILERTRLSTVARPHTVPTRSHASAKESKRPAPKRIPQVSRRGWWSPAHVLAGPAEVKGLGVT